jgi:hypothetical protein
MLKKNNPFCTVGDILTESNFPYEKKPDDPFDDLTAPAPPDGSLESPDQQPSSLPPMDNPTSNKSICQICGKVFNTKEELIMHLETEHQNTKKKV